MSPRAARRWALFALLLLVLTAGWALASVLAGRQAAAVLARLAEAPDGESSLRVRALAHEPGWFASQGSLELHWFDRCLGTGPTEALGSGRVRYRLSHGLLPGSLLRFDWTLEPVAGSAQAFERLFGARVTLSGQGQVDFSGGFSSTLALPGWQVRGHGEHIEMAPSQGTIAWGERHLGLDWKVPRLSLRGAAQAASLEIENLKLAVHLRDRLRGTGRTQLAIERVAGPRWSLDGLQTRSEVTERGDRLDASVTQSVRALRWPSQELRELAIEASVRDLHLPSVEALSRLAGQSCGFSGLGADEARRFREALRSLLVEGLSVGLTRVGGRAGQGELEGSLAIDLRREAAAGAAIALSKSLRVNAQLRLKGEVLDAEQRASVLGWGLLRETPEGLLAQLSFQGGQLQANGRELDAALLRLALESVDARLNALLADTGPAFDRRRGREDEAPVPGGDAGADRPQPAPEPLGPPDGPRR